MLFSRSLSSFLIRYIIVDICTYYDQGDVQGFEWSLKLKLALTKVFLNFVKNTASLPSLLPPLLLNVMYTKLSIHKLANQFTLRMCLWFITYTYETSLLRQTRGEFSKIVVVVTALLSDHGYFRVFLNWVQLTLC